LYEAESNTNAFTDDEKTKLAGITAGATAWDAEQTRDTIGNTLNGTTDEVTVTPDDGANTITAALAAAAKASLALADTAVQPAALADYVTKLVSINPQTGTSYTLVLADQSKMVTMNNGSANTLTVPTNASVALPVGTLINVTQLGAGLTTILGDTGVTINGVSAGSADISARYGGCWLIKLATDTWLLQGGHDGVA
jgi:hypothetical protein